MSNQLLPMETRRKLLEALRKRYSAASKVEKTRILEASVLISGYHPKSAIRLLNGVVASGNRCVRSTPVRTFYGAAVQQALLVLWEASDRLCGKRLKALLPPNPVTGVLGLILLPDVWHEIENWLKEAPRLGSAELMLKLDDRYPGKYTAGHRRTLQRRLKEWRTRVVRELVYGIRVYGNILSEAPK